MLHLSIIIDKLRKAREDMAFSSDFIVGYPGETDADFAETLRIVSDIEFAQAYFHLSTAHDLVLPLRVKWKSTSN